MTHNTKHILTQLLHFIPPLLLSLTTPSLVSANLGCPDCGTMKVPFPLSTSPNCGHQSYKIRCTQGTLWLNALNSSSYVITNIMPHIQELIIRPQSFIKNTCINTDFHAGGIWLDENLPFNISSKNTVIKINCTTLAYISAMNCSSNSICYRYIKEKHDVESRCGKTHICCSFTGGGSQNDHNIKLTPEKCASFTSFVDLPLDNVLPVSKWPDPGVAIQWVLPTEPPCSSPLDCKKLPKSSCLLDISSGHKRCLCIRNYGWDPVNGVYFNTKFSN